jgi:hypothetical protein
MKSDIFELLDETLPAPDEASGLPVISLWRVATYYLTIFTLHPDRFASHYDDDQGSYQCLSEGCPACKTGLRPTEHIYLPVWDLQNRRVAVLKFDTRPDGPAQRILPFLKLYRDKLVDVVMVVDCAGKGNFTLTARAPLPETDRGALACKAFCDGLKAGVIDLRSCVRRLTAAEVAALASVRKKAVPLVGDAVPPAGAAARVPNGLEA